MGVQFERLPFEKPRMQTTETLKSSPQCDAPHLCTGRRKALVGAYAGTMLSWSGQAIPGSTPARCRLNGTYGGQGKAVVVTPSAALLLVACLSFAQPFPTLGLQSFPLNCSAKR